VWGDLFGGAVGAFACAPAFVEEFVIRRAGLGEFVDVGVSAFGPFVDVVDFAAVARGVTTRPGTPTVLGMTVLVVHPKQDGRSAGGQPGPQVAALRAVLVSYAEQHIRKGLRS
jgi:hypothetical protein